MLGFLSTAIPINTTITPLMILIVLTVIGGFMIALFYLFSYWNNIRSKMPELDVLQQCRKRPFPPLIIIIDGAGRMLFFVGEKDKKTDVKFKKDDYGLLIDPAILTKKPKSTLIDGTTVYLYGTDTYFPIDPLGARGIVQVIRQIRKEFALFDYVKDDVVIMELIMKEGDDLLKDCETVMQRIDANQGVQEIDPDTGEIIEREEVTALELKYAIEESKKKFKTYGVSDGYFSFNDALERIPLGSTSGDFNRAIQLAQYGERNEMGSTEQKWWIAAMVFSIVAGVLILAVLILK